MSLDRSRPHRLAEESGFLNGDAGSALGSKTVLVAAGGADEAALDGLLLAVSHMVRTGANVVIAPPADNTSEFKVRCEALVHRLLGPAGRAVYGGLDTAKDFDAVLMLGTTVGTIPGWITVTADGWLARAASWLDGAGDLPRRSEPNPIGVDLAVSIGTGRIFRYLLGKNPEASVEVSGFELRSGPIGTFEVGPGLGTRLPGMNALLVGGGSVMHGWAHTIRRLPISGMARAIDPQVMGPENLGTYVEAFPEHIGQPKVEVLMQILGPQIKVTPDRDYAELFARRLENELVLPPLVVAGLDEPQPRHVVQRWWPEYLIDMGTGGFTAQLIAKARGDTGMCVIEALPLPPAELAALQRDALVSGLRPLPASDLLEAIDDADVAAAPEELRDALSHAKAAGVRRCSWILGRDIDPGSSDEFSAAAPFVAGVAGALAAAQTVRYLMDPSEAPSVRAMASLVSDRFATLGSHSALDCECQN